MTFMRQPTTGGRLALEAAMRPAAATAAGASFLF